MDEVEYRGRRAYELESDALELVVTVEGGHIAAIRDKASGINPLWEPPWPTIEPSAWSPDRHPGYGDGPEARLLAGILGHNICLDIFGPPSDEEAAAGLDVHGEAATAAYTIAREGEWLSCRADLPEAGLRFTRWLRLKSRILQIHETVENLRGVDHPVGWTQHVTLGPPFLEKGRTRFRVTGTRSKVYEGEFAPEGRGLQQPGAEFDWPHVPLRNGGTDNLEVFTSAPVSGGFTTTLMDPARDEVFFIAWSPTHRLAIGYQWKRADFPWLGRWEENLSREQPPWNGRTIALGMEFGVSPMPETRREMVERGSLFDAPAFRWIAARSRVEAEYRAAVWPADSLPERLP